MGRRVALFPLAREAMKMTKKRLEVEWNLKTSIDLSLNLRRYNRYLEDLGFRESTVDSYVGHVGRYLKFAGTDRPYGEIATRFRDALHERSLARSTINNHSFAIANYHRMLGEEVDLPFLKRNDELLFYFEQDDVLRIFGACRNLKHLAMLQTLFYGCLRASELCNLDDRDLDIKGLTIYVREGKGGRDGICYISDECARTLKHYIEVRPQLKIEGHYPLFFTDFAHRWDRRDVCRMFHCYKKKAGSKKLVESTYLHVTPQQASWWPK